MNVDPAIGQNLSYAVVLYFAAIGFALYVWTRFRK